MRAVGEDAWHSVLTRTTVTPSGRVLDVYPLAPVAAACAAIAERDEKAPTIARLVAEIKHVQGGAAPTRLPDDDRAGDYVPEDEVAAYRRAKERRDAGRTMGICDHWLVCPDDVLAHEAEIIASTEPTRTGGGSVRGDFARAGFAACGYPHLQRLVLRRLRKAGHTAAADRLATLAHTDAAEATT